MAKLVEQGDNVHVSTDRYNFAPGWFHILDFPNLLAGNNGPGFRYLVAGFWAWATPESS